MSTTGKKRGVGLGSFDLVKGLAIVLVVVCHTLVYLDFSQARGYARIARAVFAVASGCMPLFFIVSGYGLKEKPVLKTLKKTFSGLVAPYLWVMAACTVLLPLLNWNAYEGDVRALVKDALSYTGAFLLGTPQRGQVVFGFELAWNMATWFLLALFVAINVTNLIALIKKPAGQVLAAAACTAAGWGLFQLKFAFFCLPQGLMGVGMLYAGYALRRFGLLEKWQRSPWTYAVLAPVCLAQWQWCQFDLAQGIFNPPLLSYLGALCTGLLYMLFSLWSGRLEWRTLEWLRKVGRYSFWVLALHAVEDAVVPWWYWLEGIESDWAYMGVLLLCRSALIALGCAGLQKFTMYRYQQKMARRLQARAAARQKEVA